MTIAPWLVYLGASSAVGAVSRIWVVARKDIRARRMYSSRLFDESALTAALEPRSADNDDPDVLDEIASTLSHLNRQTYAEEMWALDRQLSTYYHQVPGRSRPTVERALSRLMGSGERWLVMVGARTASSIPLPNLQTDVDAAAAAAAVSATGEESSRSFAEALAQAAASLRSSLTAGR